MGKLVKMLTFVKRYGGGKYSQEGEAGIIDECINRIGLIGGVSVEFGAPTREYCSNTFHLPDWWIKYFYDVDPSDPDVIKKLITPENINELPACTILSMDTDGEDLRLWQAYKGLPDIVIIEINSSLDPMMDHFSSTKGASYISMVKLGIEKGYFLLAHTGNCVFVLHKYRNLFPEIIGDGLTNWPLYFNKSWL